jgi:hypothetical protein
MVVGSLPAVAPLVIEKPHSTRAAVTNAPACSALAGRPFCPDSGTPAVTGRPRAGGTVTGVGGRADADADAGMAMGSDPQVALIRDGYGGTWYGFGEANQRSARRRHVPR